MQDNLKDILSHLSTDIDQETLLLYLQGKLSAEQQHEVEKQLINDDFETDAVEGLQAVKNQQQLSLIVDQLNRDLKKRTQKKKDYREKLKLENPYWLYLTLIIILLLVVISYFIVRKHLQP